MELNLRHVLAIMTSKEEIIENDIVRRDDPNNFQVGEELILDGEVVTVLSVHFDRPSGLYHIECQHEDGEKYLVVSYPRNSIVDVECDIKTGKKEISELTNGRMYNVLIVDVVLKDDDIWDDG